MAILKDLTGEKFGRLTVLKFVSKAKDGHAVWLCECTCGRTVNVYRPKRTFSCGCLATELLTERSTTHGEGGKTTEYWIWRAIKIRCLNPKNKSYKHYGGRGIKICPEWLNNYEIFLHDMGRRPTKNHSIDRIDNNAGYCKENCRWATSTEQAYNRQNTIILRWCGVLATVKDWSRITGIEKATIYARLKRNWTIERVLTP